METKELISGLEKSLTEYKSATDAALNEVKEQLKVVGTTEGAAKAMEEKLNGKIAEVETKLKAVDEYTQAIEQKMKEGKSLNPAEQKHFNQLLGETLKAKWDEISKFKERKLGRSMKFDLLEDQEQKVMTITGNVQDWGASFTTVQTGIRTLPNRKVHMRELIPLGTMSTSTLTYMREIGTTGVPAPWAVGDGTTAKPEVSMNFQEVTVPAEYIAAWVLISRKMLDDMDALRSYLQMRLMEMYLKAEDAQILNGNGTSPQIEGILSVATPANSTTGPNIERLVYAASQLESSDYTATGYILHPAAYYNIALNKATGSGEYDLPGIVVVQNGQLYVAGIPVYKTTAIAANTYIVGDWQLGCQFFIREQPTIEFADQDRDNFIKNLITVRIEGRAALAIYRAEAFVYGTFTGVTS